MSPFFGPSFACLAAGAVCIAGCTSPPGTKLPRRGDEIVLCGQLFHIGVPVVLWTDPGGYDSYRTERRFVAWPASAWSASPSDSAAPIPSSPNRYSVRFAPGSKHGPLSEADFERVRGGGWEVADLRRCVDQLVLHYDAAGVSRQCFRTLHDQRGLSIHFMLDIDGTVYQTLDVKEKAWHATLSNDRSVGIEIANVGAFADGEPDPFARWYAPAPRCPGGDDASFVITIPHVLGDGGVRTPGFIGRPIRPGLIVGEVQDRLLRQHDLTAEQYRSLAHLTAALCTILPAIACDYPRDSDGRLITRSLDADRLRSYRGLLGHYHIQANKVDPGPAMQWDRVVAEATALMGTRSIHSVTSDMW